MIPYLFLLPALLVLGLTVFLPAGQAFFLSFTRYEYDLTKAPRWVGMENLQRLGSDPVFWKTLGNTILSRDSITNFGNFSSGFGNSRESSAPGDELVSGSFLYPCGNFYGGGGDCLAVVVQLQWFVQSVIKNYQYRSRALANQPPVGNL